MTDRTITFEIHAIKGHKAMHRNLVERVFGVPSDKQYNIFQNGFPDLRIICTEAQFGRFIMLRNEVGLENGIKCLNAKYVSDTRAGKYVFLDVRSNENKGCCC